MLFGVFFMASEKKIFLVNKYKHNNCIFYCVHFSIFLIGKKCKKHIFKWENTNKKCMFSLVLEKYAKAHVKFSHFLIVRKNIFYLVSRVILLPRTGRIKMRVLGAAPQ